MSVRKAGMRAGKPHYSAECPICHRVLIASGATKERAQKAVADHKKSAHNKR